MTSTKSVLPLLFVLAIPVAAQDSVPTNEALVRSLQDGVWCNSDDGGKTCTAFDEFHTNGRISACGKFAEDMRPFSAEATYEVRNRFVCMVVTEASETFALKPGFKFCTEVLQINSKVQRYRDLNSREIVTLYRRPKSAKKCPSERV